MSGAAFRLPFVQHHERTCRKCGALVITECLGGADPPVRDPHFRCYACRSATVRHVGFAELAALTRNDHEPQLVLVGEASSGRTETMDRTYNEKGRPDGPTLEHKSFGEERAPGSLARPADDLNPGGRR